MIVRILCLLVLVIARPATADTAVFAGGCFWCVEAVFQETTGVTDAVSGFTGGTLLNPTYKGDHRGHYEAVKITYDPAVITYPRLLDIFWRNVDPFDDRGQFCDKGPSYKSAIFVDSDEEEQLAQQSRSAVQAQLDTGIVVTEILPASKFWPVEEYHQNYYRKNPIRYRFYKGRCGRDKRLDEIWGDQAAR